MPTVDELAYLQSMPLNIKISLTVNRLREFIRQYGESGVYVSFSGGKDSTVLLHIVRTYFPDVPAVFCDTGLEYPEIKSFVRSFDNVTIVRPKMNFSQVIQKYGYPVVSKEVSRLAQYARKAIAEGREENNIDYLKLCGRFLNKEGGKSQYNFEKWKFLLETPFNCSSECCTVMKKKPMKQYGKETGRVPIIATMACESRLRKEQWLIHGCNAFESKHPRSQPMSFWMEQDVLQYIRENKLPIADVYGEIIPVDGQLTFDGSEKLCTTGCDRTGCIFCAFGAHLERGESRFQRLARTHPKLYAYCIEGGSYDSSDGLWKPDKNGLGMGFVFDTINEFCGKEMIRYKK